VLNNYPLLQVTLLGFTDSVGTAEYNLKLGQRRAEAVRDVLVKNGVTVSRLAVQSLGETSPIADNAVASGRARNRRVEIQVMQEPGTPAPPPLN
jgi:OOP family OmpA-OmpF porin